MTGFVRLTSPLEPETAQPLLAALQAAGFEAVVREDFIVSLAEFRRPGGQARPIYVREGQREAAEAFLAEHERAARRSPVEALACPECGGPTRRGREWPKAAAGPMRAMGLKPPAPGRVCRQCGHRWTPVRHAAFTKEELGYDPDAPLIDWRGLAAGVRRFVAWTRSIGYDRKHDRNDTETRR